MSSTQTDNIDYNKPIEYRFLNMDEERFHETEEDLLEWFRDIVASGTPVTKRVIMSHPKHAQGIIALGSKRGPFGEPFSECAAIITCKRLSGIDVRQEWIAALKKKDNP